MKHPHPDKAHVVSRIRIEILTSKRRWGTARSLVHYKALIQTYLQAKRELLSK